MPGAISGNVGSPINEFHEKNYLYVLFVIMCVFAFISCATSVERVPNDEIFDITGEWNDIDVQVVSTSLIEDFVSSDFCSDFIETYGRNPVLKIGRIKNQSSEHIDTGIISNKLKNAVIASGKADFVADKSEVTDIREEREDQQSFASWDTVKKLANETAADFMLQGSVKTIVQKNGGNSVRSYFVYAELLEIESGMIVWTGENDSIKKVIKNAQVRW